MGRFGENTVATTLATWIYPIHQNDDNEQSHNNEQSTYQSTLPHKHNANSDLSTIAAHDEPNHQILPKKSSKIKWIFLGGFTLHLCVLLIASVAGSRPAPAWNALNICTHIISLLSALFVFITWNRKFNSNSFLQEELFRATMTSPAVLIATALGLLIIAILRHFSRNQSDCVHSSLGCLPYLPGCTFSIYIFLAIYWTIAAWLVGTKLPPVSNHAVIDINEFLIRTDPSLIGEKRRFQTLRQWAGRDPIYFFWFTISAAVSCIFAVLLLTGDKLLFSGAESAQILFLWLAISLRARSGKFSYGVFGGIIILTLLGLILTAFRLPYRSLSRGVGFSLGSVLLIIEIMSLGIFHFHIEERGYHEKLKVQRSKQLFFCRNFRSKRSDIDIFVAAVEGRG